jgi:AraC family transcriptional regulator, transcriptional activator of the genes for pyochelin and ferripyochelin receptors
MCFQQAHIQTSSGASILFDRVPMETLLASNVNSQTAKDKFGEVVSHGISFDHFKIIHTTFKISEAVRLIIPTPEKSEPRLFFIMKNNLHYTIPGFARGTVLESHYNMCFLPSAVVELDFEAGQEYVSLIIEFSFPYLQRWGRSSHALSNFLGRATGKTCVWFKEEHTPICVEMNSIMQDLLRCTNDEGLKKMFLDAKVLDLLRLALQGFSSSRPIGTRSSLIAEDVKKIQDVYHFLASGNHAPDSLAQLGAKFDLTELKLKAGFKELYGTSLASFSAELRMQHAKKLLVGTDLPIKSISNISGYSNLPNFTHAFKKKFGYPPSELRT